MWRWSAHLSVRGIRCIRRGHSGSGMDGSLIIPSPSTRASRSRPGPRRPCGSVRPVGGSGSPFVAVRARAWAPNLLCAWQWHRGWAIAGDGSRLRGDRRTMDRWVHAQAGGGMNRIGRRVRAAINPVSTAATRWWCHSAMRHMLTGHGPTARQWRPIRHAQGAASFRPSAEQMKAPQRSTNCSARTITKCEPDPSGAFHMDPGVQARFSHRRVNGAG